MTLNEETNGQLELFPEFYYKPYVDYIRSAEAYEPYWVWWVEEARKPFQKRAQELKETKKKGVK